MDRGRPTHPQDAARPRRGSVLLGIQVVPVGLRRVSSTFHFCAVLVNLSAHVSYQHRIIEILMCGVPLYVEGKSEIPVYGVNRLLQDLCR